MKSDYVFLNSKTFEIENVKDIIPVDKKLAKILSILNKKGYYTQMYSKANISKPFFINEIINSLEQWALKLPKKEH